MVLHHPMFWDSLKRMFFLRDASDRLEIDDQLWPELGKEEKKVFLGFKTWDKKHDKGLFLHITRNDKHRVPIHTYQFIRLRHLLRMIMNEMSHYWEIPREITVRIGTYPEGFDSYFTSLFSKLFITVSQFISEHYMEENEFKMYLK
ncbi:Inactive serine/threonine-protein kinase/endoribonuclease IRE1-like [Cardamine amara subsp. amara]|uniref:Inactive serine/threonine-protein kinase/endoribonuclease IRE1-like n=1 Tax=Cardamine amara subsp. amara TaxID=228776 RepID=A0ABD0Z4U1_CARAN